MKIIQATIQELNDLVPLFDLYRVFYEKTSDITAAKEFLKDRISKNESVIFLAYSNKRPAGFTQLYKTFSSTTMQPFYILNDLYVDEIYRGKSIGKALLEKAQEFCKEKGFKGLALETANDNPAQKLYEKLGWVKNMEYLHYFWSNPKS